MSPSQSTMFTHNLKQTAVYWGDPKNDGFGGRTFDAPVEISVRWEETSELFIDASGQEARSRAVVYVAQDVDIGGYLYLASLDDLSSALEGPMQIEKAYEIRGFAKIPSIKADKFMRKAWL